MPLRLRPADPVFVRLFAEQAGHLVVGAGLLAEMLGEGTDREATSDKMREVEHACDETTHEIIRLVNSTNAAPFERTDIYSLAAALDDVMDFMEEAVDRVVLYGVETLPTEAAHQVDVLQRAADLTAEAMPRLQTLKDLDEYWIEVNRLENQADKIYRSVVARLFNGSTAALDVLKLKGVVDALESAADAFEKVAHLVEQIAVKSS